MRLSVDVFGLSATHDLGIGQVPGRLAKYVDAVYPMVYPSHYSSGEFNLPDPSAAPGQTVARSLRDFRNAMLGRTYTLDDVRAQVQAARLRHADGFLLWNAEGLYDTHALQPPA